MTDRNDVNWDDGRRNPALEWAIFVAALVFLVLAAVVIL